MKSTDLKSKLAASLPALGQDAPVPTLHQFDHQPHFLPNPSPVQRRRPAPKLSITLYQTDLDRMDAIRAFLRERGVRKLSDSEALRLACRRVAIDEGLLRTYREMQADDCRRNAGQQ